MDRLERDYIDCRAHARYWAKIAISNKRNGEPWQDAARNAHEAFDWARLITGGVVRSLRNIEVT